MEMLTIVGGMLFVTLCIIAWRKRFLIVGTASFAVVLYLIFRSDQIETIELPNVCAIGILLTFTILILSIPSHTETQDQREAHR